MSEPLASILAYFDLKVFLCINHVLHTPFTDTIALAISGIGAFGIIFLAIGFVLFIREEQKDHRFFVACTSALITSWVLAEGVIKPWIAKPRPYAIGPWGYAIIVDHGVRGYSFPSSHATFAFALAVVLSAKEPRYRYMIFAVATMISLSRIYLGVHFPIDVLAGAVLGWAIGKSAVVFSGIGKEQRVSKAQSDTRQTKKSHGSSRRSKMF